MFLRRLAMHNYSVFDNADFDLSTTPDRPLILITANNGGGKTSMLSAFRLALHGRRAFDAPVAERDYLQWISARFHRGDASKPCSIELDFDYVDHYTTRKVKLVRQWAVRRKNISEHVELLLDGQELAQEDADDFLTSVVPPEAARYFFFDGERIRELADWDADDEIQLFQAVGDLLGIKLIDQLGRDLLHLKELANRAASEPRDVTGQLAQARLRAQDTHLAYQSERAEARRIRGNYDRAVATLRGLGVLHSDELNDIRDRLAALQAERASLHEEARRAAHDILPLLCARRLRRKLGADLERRRDLEEREIVQRFLTDRAKQLNDALRRHSFLAAQRRLVFQVFEEAARGRPVAIEHYLPSVSPAEAAWMQRVVERELPELEARISGMAHRLHVLEPEIVRHTERLRSTPKDDPKSEAALAELERAQRELLEHETRLANLLGERDAADKTLKELEKQARTQRLAAFQGRRLLLREHLLAGVLEALPSLAEKLERSKQQRFSQYLLASLQTLWHKTDRVVSVDVSFPERRIELRDAHGILSKRDLSAGEKQLFATAFIYSLARLSGRHMPFVIDTPLGRLDYEHRCRFVAEFLPVASHQTLLLATDTEIVGQLYSDIEDLIAHHYELATFNGGVTTPVQLAVAT